MSFEKISDKLEISNPYWTYKQESYRLPNDTVLDYYYADTNGSTMIIGILDNNNFLLTKQFRYLNQKESIEFAGGGIQ